MTAADTTWSPFEPTNAIGDPGRQPEIRSVSSELNVGVADTALDFLSVGSLELRACSSRGWSHRYKGTPRQDAYSVLVGDDALVIAVADGVSEGDFSQVAADTAARAAVKLAANDMAKNGAVDWALLARRVAVRIVEEAEYRQIVAPPDAEADINERVKAVRAKMSTTLIAAIIKRSPTHEGYETEIGVVAGDSAAYQLTVGSDVLTPVGGGKALGGPISSTSVKPLPGPANPEATTVFLRPGEMLVLGTDGIGDPVGDGTNDFGRELANRWQTPPTIESFLLDINVYRRTFDDDRTAVAVWLRPDAVLPEAPVEPVEPVEAAMPEPVAATDTPAIDEADPEEAPAPRATATPEPPARADDLTALADAVSGPTAPTPSAPQRPTVGPVASGAPVEPTVPATERRTPSTRYGAPGYVDEAGVWHATTRPATPAAEPTQGSGPELSGEPPFEPTQYPKES